MGSQSLSMDVSISFVSVDCSQVIEINDREFLSIEFFPSAIAVVNLMIPFYVKDLHFEALRHQKLLLLWICRVSFIAHTDTRWIKPIVAAEYKEHWC